MVPKPVSQAERIDTVMGRLNEWADLHKAKKDLDATVENVKATMAALEDKILEEMGADGVTNVKMAQGTVYVHTQSFASIVQDKKVFAALRRAGWGDLVKNTVNTQSLSAVVREKGVPPSLEKHVTVHEKTSLRLRSTLDAKNQNSKGAISYATQEATANGVHSHRLHAAGGR